MEVDGAKQVEQLSVESLVPYALNAKVHSDGQVAAIARSIERFGFNNPVLVDKDSVLIAGHGRLMAAHELGMSHVPVVRLEHLSEVEARAYRLADNRLAELSGWDFGLVTEEMLSLREEDGLDITELGWSGHELDIILQADFNPDAKEALPGKDEGGSQSVAFSGDQWAVVGEVLKQYRLTHDDKASNSEVLTQVATEWGSSKT